MSETAPSSSRGRREVPTVALLADDGSTDLVAGFPGRFNVTVCTTPDELDALVLTAPLDVVLLDCRRGIPDRPLLDVVRDQPVVDFLAVGKPDDRRTLPSWMTSHAVPWPMERRAFYRLVTTTARLGAARREAWRLTRALDELEEEASLGRRVAQLLHEVGNPLDAALRFVRIVQGRVDDEQTLEYLDNAMLGLRRVAETVELLHRDARQTASRLNLVDLRDVLREASVTAGLDTSTMRVRVRLDDDERRVPRALGSVLTTLLVNARQATSDRGELEVVAKIHDDDLEVTITDDGEGFGDLFKDQLFDPWFTTKLETGGTGLGLPGARSLVERLGGTLDASSPGLGHGATFTVRLPEFASRGPTGEVRTLPVSEGETE